MQEGTFVAPVHADNRVNAVIDQALRRGREIVDEARAPNLRHLIVISATTHYLELSEAELHQLVLDSLHHLEVTLEALRRG